MRIFSAWSLFPNQIQPVARPLHQILPRIDSHCLTAARQSQSGLLTDFTLPEVPCPFRCNISSGSNSSQLRSTIYPVSISFTSLAPSTTRSSLEATATMSDLNSWEDDPAAQDENLSRQAQQQMNLNSQPQQAPGGFHAGASAFTPGAATFTPGAAAFQPGQQAYGGYPQYGQQQYYGGGQGYYPQYGGGQFNQYGGQQAYGQVYGGQQGGYNAGGYGRSHPSIIPSLAC